jgi:uncharacterized membrane protein YhaH (DUF805 family)
MDLFSIEGRANRLRFFFTVLFAAIGEGFLALGLNDLEPSFAPANFFLIAAVATLPFAWVQICVTLKRLDDLKWAKGIALLAIPAYFWPLWYLFHAVAPSGGQFVFGAFGVCALALFACLSLIGTPAGSLPRRAAPKLPPVAPFPPPAMPQPVRPPEPALPVQPSMVASYPANQVEGETTQSPLSGGFDPVVGWLVVTEGPRKGDQHRLRSERNRIGSASYMEISIPAPGIQNVEHAVLTYDARNIRYSLAPGSGVVWIRANGASRPITTPTLLEPYDRICLNETTLIFVPLCGPYHRW